MKLRKLMKVRNNIFGNPFPALLISTSWAGVNPALR